MSRLIDADKLIEDEVWVEIGRFKEVQKVLNTIDKYGVGEIDGVD